MGAVDEYSRRQTDAQSNDERIIRSNAQMTELAGEFDAEEEDPPYDASAGDFAQPAFLDEAAASQREADRNKRVVSNYMESLLNQQRDRVLKSINTQTEVQE